LLGPQGLGYLIFGVTAVLYALDLWLSDGNGRDRARERSRDTGLSTRLVVAVLALVVVVSATAAMVAPAGTQKFGVVSAESDAPGARVIEQGTTESFAYPVDNGGVVPVLAYVEPASDGVAVEDGQQYVPGRSVRNATVSLSTPPDTGFYRRFVTQRRYLAVLPAGTIDTLHDIHPWLPVVAIDALLGGGFYAGAVTLTGRGRLRSRDRASPAASGLGRVLRWLQ
jgi:signal peptidase